jgi:hypothetical protein
VFNLSGGGILYRRFVGVGTTFGDDTSRTWWGHAHPQTVPMSVARCGGRLGSRYRVLL